MKTRNTTPMKIAILGTRGIPNQYGGFEQFAEYLSLGLHELGHQVGVYVPNFHPYKGLEFQGVKLHRITSPEKYLGATANFLYDYLCLRDAISRGYDIALECGYGTASPSYYLLPLGNTKVVTNMDGLEWKRSKWSPMVQRFTQWTESLAVRKSHALVADNIGIQEYITSTYGSSSTYIPYGSDLVPTPSSSPLEQYQLQVGKYFLVIARLEPENNLEMIIEGYQASGSLDPLLIVGSQGTAHGLDLSARFGRLPGLRFLGAIYDKPTLDALRHHATLYFHGHSVGGTNPSLLEAMGCGTLIAAHDNPFNRDVIKDMAFYFCKADDIRRLIQESPHAEAPVFQSSNLRRIEENFSWPSIIRQYEALFMQLLEGEPQRPSGKP